MADSQEQKDYVGFWERLKAGNIDDEGSEAYQRWNPKAKAAREAAAENENQRRDAKLADSKAVDVAEPMAQHNMPDKELIESDAAGFAQAFAEYDKSDSVTPEATKTATQTPAKPNVKAVAKPVPARHPVASSQPPKAAVANKTPDVIAADVSEDPLFMASKGKSVTPTKPQAKKPPSQMDNSTVSVWDKFKKWFDNTPWLRRRPCKIGLPLSWAHWAQRCSLSLPRLRASAG